MSSARSLHSPPSSEPAGLGRVQLAWLAAAVFVVSAGYGALMPLLPAWLEPLMAADGKAEVARHVGLLSPIVHSIPVQLLAYHTSIARGTDVDKPRNLAKSVTVE